ncbi:LCP family protein [Actinomyces trachealis]|uniref:LCP family protein n=1 Tax=Actinomyces trachealis TaxID=2763540 RepID=UPI001892A1DD|nr:LCP family protein [Actinomyces trachealis]
MNQDDTTTETTQTTETIDGSTRMRSATATARARLCTVCSNHRILTAICTLLTLIVVATGVDVGVLMARPERFSLQVPTVTSSAPETWLVVGTDSRETVPGDQSQFGTVEQTGEGKRADVIALIQLRDGKVSVALIPRDLTVGTSFFEQERLSGSFLQGPQHTADLLCENLGVPVNHLITVDMAQFAKIVDSLGGVDVDIPEPVHDVYAGLNIQHAGPTHLDGISALALVRSRHPVVLRDGNWVALSEEEGAKRRTESSGIVMRQVMTAARTKAHSPIATHSLAHLVASNIGLDYGTGPLDLLRLANAVLSTNQIDVVDVPGPLINDTFVALPTDDTYRVLGELGYAKGTCTPTN